MKIVVCIKQVPDTTEIRIDPKTGTMIREGVPSIINPDDKGALEYALKLKDDFGANVTAITMGPPQADLVLREALAMGADRAILLTDRAFAGADTLATSSALAGALRCLDFDIVITGRQAIDGDTAQVGPQTAEHLSLPQVSYVAGLEWNGSTLRLKQQNENGYRILEVEPPVLITVLASAVTPRYMSVRGIVEAYKHEVEVWSAQQIDVAVERLGLKGSPTRVQSSFTKGTKQAGVQYELSAEESVDLIVDKLRERHLIR